MPGRRSDAEPALLTGIASALTSDRLSDIGGGPIFCEFLVEVRAL